MTQLPPLLLIALFVTNLMIPAYFTNKVFEVNIFRYIFFFTPILYVYSWTLCLKSLFLGLLASIMWKNYDPESMKKGPPQNFIVLRIIIEICSLYLTCCLFFMVLNPSIYKDYKELLKFIIVLKVSLNLGVLILFRPLSYYLDGIIEFKSCSYIESLLGFLKKILVILHIIIYSLAEYYSLTNQNLFFIRVTDKNLTELSQIAMVVIVGRLLAGISSETMKKVIKGSFPLFLGISSHILATILLTKKVLIVPYCLRKTCLCCMEKTNVDLIASTLLFSFGDACYSNYYFNVNADYTDQTAEALALVKVGQIIILSLVSFNVNTGYVLAFTLFYYLCSINIEEN